MKKVVLSVIIVVNLMFLFIMPTDSSENVSIDIYNQVIKAINPEHSFVGVNWLDDGKINETVFLSPIYRNALIKALKDTNIDILRFPGGQNVTYYFWDISNNKLFEALKKYKESDESHAPFYNQKPTYRINLPSFLSFCRDGKFKATVQVNTHTYYDRDLDKIVPLKAHQREQNNTKRHETGQVDWDIVDKAAQNTAEQVKWMKENGYSNIVKYWELGNEEHVIVPLSAVYSGTEYGKVAARFIKAMKKADPDIKIIITNPTGISKPDEKIVYNTYAFQNNWSKGVLSTPELKSLRNNVFAASSHMYPWWNTHHNFSLSAFKYNIQNNDEMNVERNMNHQKDLLNQSGFNNTVIFLNEFNPCHFNNDYAHSWLGATGTAQMVLSCANNRHCYHMDYHQLLHPRTKNGMYSNQGFGLYHFAKDFDPAFIFHPVTTAIAFLNENIKGNILKTGYDKSKLTATAIIDNDIVRLIMLNKDKERTVTINLSDFKELKLLRTKSLGIDVPETFSSIADGDSYTNPSEVAVLNVLNDALKISKTQSGYNVVLPANVIAVIEYRKAK